MFEGIRHKNIRSATAQEIFLDRDLESVVADYYDRYPPMELDLSMDTYNLGAADERTVAELSKTVRAHTIDMNMHAALLSYEVANANNMALAEFTSLLDTGELEAFLSHYSGDMANLTLTRAHFPLPLKRCITYLRDRAIKHRMSALDDEWRLEKDYRYIRLELLHRRLHRLRRCVEGTPYDGIVRISDRLLNFEPRDHGYSTQQEEAILKDKQGYIDVAIPFIENHKWAELEGGLTTEAIFAASHAVEECYPGIAGRDVTRILLQNLPVLSKISRQQKTNRIYHSTVALRDDERPTAGSFFTFIDRAISREKMILDEQNMLHIPLKSDRGGNCPLGFIYEASVERVKRAHSFYDSLQNNYDITIPRSPYIDPATEHMAMAVLSAEFFFSGQAHHIIDNFKGTLLADAALRASCAGVSK